MKKTNHWKIIGLILMFFTHSSFAQQQQSRMLDNAPPEKPKEKSSIFYSLYTGNNFKAGGGSTSSGQFGFALGRGIAHNNLGIALHMTIRDSYISPNLDSATGIYPKIIMSSLKGMFTLNIPEHWSKLFQGPAIGFVGGLGFTGAENQGKIATFEGVLLQINANWWNDIGNKNTGSLRFGLFARCIYNVLQDPDVKRSVFVGNIDVGINIGIRPYEASSDKKKSDNGSGQ